MDEVPLSASVPDRATSGAAERVRRVKTLAAVAVAVAVIVGYVVVVRALDARQQSRDRADTSVPILDPRVLDVVGRDYRDAATRLAPLGARVLLALDPVPAEPTGTVTRTRPAAGEPVERGAELIVFVAWDGQQRLPPRFDEPVRPAPGESVYETIARMRAGSAVHSIPTFPPGELIAGIASATPDDRCAVVGDRYGTVRFVHDELVGCITNAGFVRLDAFDAVLRPIGTMPDLIGLPYADAVARLRGLETHGFLAQVDGRNQPARVIATLPTAGEAITRLTRPLLTLDGPPDPASIRVPS